MEAMPRPRPPHLQRETTRHGRTIWYVRVGHGPRIRLRAAIGSPEFEAEYRAAIEGTTPAAQRAPGAGSLAWLERLYRESADWADLSPATRRQRENILRGAVERAGAAPLAEIDAATIRCSMDDRTVRRWEDGERDIPGPVIVLCDLSTRLAAVAQALISAGKKAAQ